MTAEPLTSPREWVQALRKAGCDGKERLSRNVARLVARRQREKGVQVHEYACRFCGRYHIGTTF